MPDAKGRFRGIFISRDLPWHRKGSNDSFSNDDPRVWLDWDLTDEERERLYGPGTPVTRKHALRGDGTIVEVSGRPLVERR